VAGEWASPESAEDAATRECLGEVLSYHTADQEYLYVFAFSHQNFPMRMTLDLPDPLFKAVKIRAVQQGVTLKELLASLIEAGLLAAQPSEADPASEIPPPPPVAWPADGSVTPARSNAELFAILDAEVTETISSTLLKI